MNDARTFKIDDPALKGDDVKSWQAEIKAEFDKLDISCPIVADGVYGIATRSYTASLCNALGMIASEVMAQGVTPELRTRIRHRDLTRVEAQRMSSPELIEWRRQLRKRYDDSSVNVHRPVTKIVEDSWGYHPGVHDGLDVICVPEAVCFAMVKSKIIDVRSSGWWGLGAHASAGHPISDGDGIVQMEVLETVGPFVKGHHIGYGHNEKAVVHVGQIVEAGATVAHAGFANAWHIHMMYNDGSPGTRGVGNLDPRGILDYAVAHG